MHARSFAVAAAVIVFTAALPAHAASAVVEGTITKIGCHNVVAADPLSRVCFIEWEASAGVRPVLPATLPASCRNSSEVRWDLGDSPSGQANLQLLNAAFLAGKRIRLGLTADACFSRQNVFPTFEYVYVLR